MDRLAGPTRGQCACGRTIGPTAGRVLGDANGVIPACPDCWVTPSRNELTSVYSAVRAYREGRGGRKGGEADD